MKKRHFIRSPKLQYYQKTLKEDLNISTRNDCSSKIEHYQLILNNYISKLKYFQAKLSKGIKSPSILKIQIIQGTSIPSRNFLCYHSSTHMSVSIDSIKNGASQHIQTMHTTHEYGNSPKWNRIFTFRPANAESISIICYYHGMLCKISQIGIEQTYMLSSLKDGNIRKVQIPLHSINGAVMGEVSIKMQYLTNKAIKISELVESLKLEIDIIKVIIERYSAGLNSFHEEERTTSFDGGFYQKLLPKK